MAKWLDESASEEKWLDESDEFDQSVKAGTNTIWQTLGSVGSRWVDFLAGPIDRVLKVTDAAFGGKGKTVEKAGDLGIQAADMAVGFPADIAGKTRNATARFGMSGSSMSQKEIGQEAESAEDLGPGFEWMKAPFAALKKLTTGKEAKEVVPISEWIGHYADTLERSTGGHITAEDTKFALGAIFDLAGVAGVKAAAVNMAKRGVLKKAQADKLKAAEDAAAKTREAAEAERPARESAAAAEKARGEYEARRQSAQAAEAAQARWLEENPEFRPEEPVAAVETPIESSTASVQASPTIIGQPRPALETALEKAKAGELATMTAEERIALRGLEKNPQILDAEGKAPQPRGDFGQAGLAHPELLAYIAAGGTAASWIANHPEDAELMGGAGLAIGAIKGARGEGKINLREIAEVEPSLAPKAEAAERFFGKNEVEKEAWEEYAKGNRSDNLRQRGNIDPKLLAGMAAVGGGAAAGAMYGEDLRSTILGAIGGALVGTSAGRGMLATPRIAFNHYLGALSTRIENISPALSLRARNMEKGIMQRVDKSLDAVHPFVAAVRGLKGDEAKAVDRALLNEDFDALPAKVKEGYAPVRQLLSSIGSDLKGLGRFKEGVAEYFPRIVKDIDGLKEAIGAENARGLEKALLDAQAKKGDPLTDVEQSIIVNRYLAAPDKAGFLPGYAKGRKISEVTPELQPFYERPTDALVRYIAGAVDDIEKAKFFGKDLKNKTEGGKTYVDTKASVGELVQRLRTEGKIDGAKELELRKLLQSRFEGGETQMSGPRQDIRNLSNLGLLGNYWSAATQIGDSIMSVYHHGMKPTYEALVQKATGKEALTAKELGVVNHVMEELSNQRTSGKLLQKGLQLSAFSAIDRFAKGLNVNASLVKNRNMVKTPKGAEHFAEKWQEAYGDDFPQLVRDLKEGKITDLTESLAFSELSNIQPISKLEMPQAYLDNPNGRLLYQMKTYMLKQADVVRRDVYKEIKSGNPRRMAAGVKNAALLAGTYALANVPGDAIKAFLSGQDFDITGPGLMENILQTFGVNRYAADQLRQGRVKPVLQDMVTPPGVQMSVDVIGGDDRAARYIPLVGRGIYDYFLGGNERKEIADRKATPKDERKPLSPDAQEYQKRKREERKLRGVSNTDESSFAKKVQGMNAREAYRMQEREDLLRTAEKKLRRKLTRGEIMDFLAAEEQAEIRRAMPQRRIREVM